VPSVNEKQKTLMCIALSIKKGETPESYSKEAARISQQMSVEQLEDYCKSKVKS